MSNVITMNAKPATTEIHHFRNNPIRTIEREGGIWFVANDVCKALEHTNSRQAVARLDDDERALVIISDAASNQHGDCGTRSLEVNIISESGLYSLILSSRKKQAKAFKRWVTHDVLPAIRKDGGYIKDEEKVTTGEMNEDEFILKAYDMLMKKSKRLEAVIEEHLKQLTVHEWAALNHLYLSKGQRVRLGEAASFLCRENQFILRKQNQHISNFKGGFEVTVGVYPKHILDEAALLVGIEGNFSLNLAVSA